MFINGLAMNYLPKVQMPQPKIRPQKEAHYDDKSEILSKNGSSSAAKKYWYTLPIFQYDDKRFINRTGNLLVQNRCQH